VNTFYNLSAIALGMINAGSLLPAYPIFVKLVLGLFKNYGLLPGSVIDYDNVTLHFFLMSLSKY